MTPAPVVVLATPHSRAAHAAALIGGHPRTFVLPELRLFAAERVDALLALAEHGDARGNDGLLRAVAALFCGGQQAGPVDDAKRLLDRRRDWSTAALFDWLTARIAPRTAVFHDLSAPLHIVELDRWRGAAPDAAFVHLVRHPAGFVADAKRAMRERLYIPPDYSDHNGHPSLAPELLWFRVHATLGREFADSRSGRYRTLRLEALQQRTHATLAALCAWLGWPANDATLTAMQDTAGTPFAMPGPANAPAGAEADFLAAPRFTVPLAAHSRGPKLADSGLAADIVARARAFGYD